MRLSLPVPTGNGCYVDGARGQYALTYFLTTFADLDDLEQQTIDDYLAGEDFNGAKADTITYMADDLENMVNEALPEEQSAGWFDGEFFINADVDEEVTL